jgi:putative transcriptional regulator
VSEPSTSLEDLLDRRVPSALARQDAAMVEAGIATEELAATRNALAAFAVASTILEAPSSTLRDRVVASRGRPGKYGIFADRVARLFDLPIARAEELMQRIEHPDAWTPFFVDGVQMIPVIGGSKCDGAIATLVRIEPGARFPEHAHRGDETMLVLDGGFRETGDGEGDAALGSAREAWRGDEIFRADGTEHALVGLPGVPCIAAVVIFGHADFR